MPSKNPICPPFTVTKIATFSMLSALSRGRSKHKLTLLNILQTLFYLLSNIYQIPNKMGHLQHLNTNKALGYDPIYHEVMLFYSNHQQIHVQIT